MNVGQPNPCSMSLRFLLGDRVTVTAGNVVRHGRTAMAGVLRNMGNDVQFGERRNELLSIVTLVIAEGDFSHFIGDLAGIGDHGLGGFPFGMAIGRGDDRTGNESVAVIAQGVSHVAQLTGGIALAVQPGVRVRARGVGVIAARLAFEVAAVVIVAIFAQETLVSRPGLDERAIDTEMFA